MQFINTLNTLFIIFNNNKKYNCDKLQLHDRIVIRNFEVFVINLGFNSIINMVKSSYEVK